MKYKSIRWLGILTLTLSGVCHAARPPDMQHGNTLAQPAPKIAIVIDDLGYQKASSQQLATMPYPITMAVIPTATFAHDVARLAKKHHQELILHIPMETHKERRWEDGLTTAMHHSELRIKLNTMLDQFPDIVGINNHGGSKMTEDSQRMLWVSRILSKRGLYFLDSKTSSDSRVTAAAKNLGIRYAARDVFLDNSRQPEAIAAEFTRLKNIARRHGQAIAIGHPYPETLAQLKIQLPVLIEEGFELAFCSQLLTASPITYTRQHVRPTY